jgi:hypothetical protein
MKNYELKTLSNKKKEEMFKKNIERNRNRNRRQ